MKLLSTRLRRATPRKLGQCLRLGHRRGQHHLLPARNRARHDRLDQRRARRAADSRQHVLLVVGVDTEVAGGELGGVLEFGERLVGRHQHGVFRGGQGADQDLAFLTSRS
jgi:hypothetical protein